jgi:hypothetical protein
VTDSDKHSSFSKFGFSYEYEKALQYKPMVPIQGMAPALPTNNRLGWR